MKKLKLLIVIFSLALCIPLAYFVFRTYRGLEQEEVATLRYFADTLFDKMEGALAEMVKKEDGPLTNSIIKYIHPAGKAKPASRSHLLCPGCPGKIMFWDIFRIIRTAHFKLPWWGAPVCRRPILSPGSRP